MAITVQEAAKLLGISYDSIKRRIYKGDIKAEKNGKSWAIDEESINNKKSTVLDLCGVKFTPSTEFDFFAIHWHKFIGTLRDGVDIFNNGFQPDELIMMSNGKLNLPACFNSKGHGGVYELPPYSPNDFKYADFKPTHWSKWLEIPKVKL